MNIKKGDLVSFRVSRSKMEMPKGFLSGVGSDVPKIKTESRTVARRVLRTDGSTVLVRFQGKINAMPLSVVQLIG